MYERNFLGRFKDERIEPPAPERAAFTLVAIDVDSSWWASAR